METASGRKAAPQRPFDVVADIADAKAPLTRQFRDVKAEVAAVLASATQLCDSVCSDESDAFEDLWADRMVGHIGV